MALYGNYLHAQFFSSATNHPKTIMSFGQKKEGGILKI
jgi:hypothetical protein